VPSDTKLRLMRPLMLVNLLQPWLKFNNSYAAVGVKIRRNRFGPDFPCYGGSFFCTLRPDAARYVRDYARANPEAVAFFKRLLAPEEVFMHSVLVNSGKFRFTPDAKRYIDWTGQRHTHPRTLGVADLGPILASGAHWARKVDLAADAELFDLLDEHVRPAGSAPADQAGSAPGSARR
jgi:hypothetical protein